MKARAALSLALTATTLWSSAAPAWAQIVIDAPAVPTAAPVIIPAMPMQLTNPAPVLFSEFRAIAPLALNRLTPLPPLRGKERMGGKVMKPRAMPSSFQTLSVVGRRLEALGDAPSASSARVQELDRLFSGSLQNDYMPIDFTPHPTLPRRGGGERNEGEVVIERRMGLNALDDEDSDPAWQAREERVDKLRESRDGATGWMRFGGFMVFLFAPPAILLYPHLPSIAWKAGLLAGAGVGLLLAGWIDRLSIDRRIRSLENPSRPKDIVLRPGVRIERKPAPLLPEVPAMKSEDLFRHWIRSDVDRMLGEFVKENAGAWNRITGVTGIAKDVAEEFLSSMNRGDKPSFELYRNTSRAPTYVRGPKGETASQLLWNRLKEDRGTREESLLRYLILNRKRAAEATEGTLTSRFGPGGPARRRPSSSLPSFTRAALTVFLLSWVPLVGAIAVHEFGHFAAAKALHVPVYEVNLFRLRTDNFGEVNGWNGHVIHKSASPGKNFLVSLAGPAFSILYALAWTAGLGFTIFAGVQSGDWNVPLLIYTGLQTLIGLGLARHTLRAEPESDMDHANRHWREMNSRE